MHPRFSDGLVREHPILYTPPIPPDAIRQTHTLPAVPDWSRSPIPTLITDARRLYINARDNAEISALLTTYKVTAATLDEGLALLQAVVDASSAYGAETVDASQATGAVQAATDEVADAYTEDREMARIPYPRGSDEYEALRLAGSPPRARAEILGDARDFYNTLQARPDLIDPIPGLTPETVTARLAAVLATDTDDTTQTAEEGEAQVASDARKAAVTALRRHASQTARIARRALADRPQLREILGLLERS